MLGIVYLVLAVLTGNEIAKALLLRKAGENEKTGNRLWLVMPIAFGTGILALTWPLYMISSLFSICAGVQHPLLYANVLVMGGAAAGLGWLFYRRRKNRNGKSPNFTEQMISNKKLLKKEAVFFSILLLFLTFIMFYVFHIADGKLYSGFTVYGDYAPHTAMMRSFSWGDNFPTQYPHYGGADVKYHFMFQFLAGNLEYLGLRLDLAYNIPSIASLLGFLMLIYQLAGRIVGGFGSGVAAVVLFFFRSGLAFFQFIVEHWKAGDLWKSLTENTSFIGYTVNEDWGLWNFNVYLNQRHLAFGLLIVAAAIWIYLDWLEAGTKHTETGFSWFYRRIFTKEAWKSKSLDTALILGMLLGLCAFWNGAALIGGLLILCGFAVFSDGKIDYAVTAAVAVVFSVLQSKIFIAGEAMSPSLHWGFLAENTSITGVFSYLIQMSGIFFLGAVVLLIFLKRRERVILVSFLVPALFAFVVSLTPDINVNHKYLMISYAFLTIFWGGAIGRLWKKGWCVKVAAVLLTFCLTITGIYDMVTIFRANDRGHRMAVDMESSLTRWLGENLKKNDLLLTPEYSMNEVTMSGVMLYCGWPYYAWSAGYDTNYRAAEAVIIYTTDSRETLKETVEQEKITYILFQDGMEFEQQKCREDIIAQTYPKVYTSEDGSIRIYEA